jgi:hypothetical protein
MNLNNKKIENIIQMLQFFFHKIVSLDKKIKNKFMKFGKHIIFILTQKHFC